MNVSNHSLAEINYHLAMLIENGSMKGKTGSDYPMVSKLTWKGHELLDDIRDSSVRESTKARIAGLLGVALAVIAELAKAEIKKSSVYSGVAMLHSDIVPEHECDGELIELTPDPSASDVASWSWCGAESTFQADSDWVTIVLPGCGTDRQVFWRWRRLIGLSPLGRSALEQ